MCLSTKDIKPERVKASFWHSIVIDEEGTLYKAGQIKKCGKEETEYVKLPLSTKATLVACGKTNTIVVGEDNKIYVQG
jgi:alpha-tubulin suppressor-like RCC1 family protein